MAKENLWNGIQNLKVQNHLIFEVEFHILMLNVQNLSYIPRVLGCMVKLLQYVDNNNTHTCV